MSNFNSQQHLHMINPSQSPRYDLLFPHFPTLPPELRTMIWQQSLRRNRLLDINIKPLHKEDNNNDCDKDNGSTTTTHTSSGDVSAAETSPSAALLLENRSYAANIAIPSQTKAIFVVSRESRSAALSFYRVRLPYYYCEFSSSGFEVTREKPAVFYFNPEYDLLNIKIDRHLGNEVINLINFLDDLRTYDPQNNGLLNLAVDSTCMTLIHEYIQRLDSPARAILIDYLLYIDEITFMAKFNRRVIGPVQCYHEREIGIRFNHSMPIRPRAMFFDPPKSDAREIAYDLEKVLVSSTDPRGMCAEWQELCTKWLPTRPSTKPAARQRLLIAYDVACYDPTIWDPKIAKEFLIKEEEEWIAGQHKWSRVVRRYTGRYPPFEGPEELAKAVRPAIGFWVFPLDVLGDIQEGYRKPKRTLDLSSHWPELALLSFS